MVCHVLHAVIMTDIFNGATMVDILVKPSHQMPLSTQLDQSNPDLEAHSCRDF